MEEGVCVQFIGWLADKSWVSEVYFRALGEVTSLRSAFYCVQAHPTSLYTRHSLQNFTSPLGGSTRNEICAPFAKSSSSWMTAETKTGQTYPSWRLLCLLLPIGLSSTCCHTVSLTTLFCNKQINNDTFTFLYHSPLLNAFWRAIFPSHPHICSMG